MQYRKLGKTGLEVSEIGFGGIPIQRVSMDEAVGIIKKALELGINFFDTARGYTDSEEKMGTAFARAGVRREDLVLATKSLARDKEKIKEEVEKSLRLLQTDYIDIFQLHNVSNEEKMEMVLESGGAYEGLVEARREGKIRFIGISTHTGKTAAEALERAEFDTIQFPFNVIETEILKDILPLIRRSGTGAVVMKPFCGGVLSRNKAALQFILGYPVSSVIPGMQTEEEVIENVSASESPPLTAEQIEKLRLEAKELGTRFCRRCEYCLPCPEGVNIPFNFLMIGYFKRYGLHDWAQERYYSQEILASGCVNCGECEEKCPYNLPVREMLVECRSVLEGEK